MGFGSLMGQSPATPGQLEDHQLAKRGTHSAAQAKGVFSQAVRLVVEDTAALWDKPALPGWDENEEGKGKVKPGSSGLVSGGAVAGKVEVGGHTHEGEEERDEGRKPRKRRKVHLVVLTHGLHSNLGADMLFLKESIDATAKKAKEERRERRRKERGQRRKRDSSEGDDDKTGTDESKVDVEEAGSDDDEEEVIVRGFANNVCRTERGIQYLGKRLAKWILSITYPDQPFLPAKKSMGRTISRVFTGQSATDPRVGTPEHKNSSIYKPAGKKQDPLPYKITSISFIAHSLGGLTQTYAIAYIHKHSPHFFNEIKPVNFVALAAPWLGLSNENPLYVRFALDFGLVGRTGQDLGLTWKSTTALRGGWDSMIAGIGSDGQRAQKQADPGSKPLLRILPTGHTHQVLKMFRNRTVYSNVVNDGIVPLRTSCLLFLDWSGLGRVEKARRENGLVAGLAGWGWAELTGANASSRHLRAEPDSDAWSQSNVSVDGTRSRSRSRSRRPSSRQVPQPEEKDLEDDNASLRAESPKSSQFLTANRFTGSETDSTKGAQEPETQPAANPIAGFLSLFRPGQNKSSQQTPSPSRKQSKIYKRSQTVRVQAPDDTTPNNNNNNRPSSPSTTNTTTTTDDPSSSSAEPSRRPSNVRGNSLLDNPQDSMIAPPKTTIFESAGDILNPPLPSQEFIMSPSSRPRTIFHDRVYHPEDIPPPPTQPQLKKPRLKATVSSERVERVERVKQTPPGQLVRASTVYGDGDGGMPVVSQINVGSSSKTSSGDKSSSSTNSSIGATTDTTNANHNNTSNSNSQPLPDTSGMKVEEKIARAYHHGLSWRKVLVRLEPDAHNNMVVRRMFANAYGWPVVKHIVDTHFGDTFEANTADRWEPGVERADDDVNVREHGGEGEKKQEEGSEKEKKKELGKDEEKEGKEGEDGDERRKPKRTDSENREASDFVPELRHGKKDRDRDKDKDKDGGASGNDGASGGNSRGSSINNTLPSPSSTTTTSSQSTLGPGHGSGFGVGSGSRPGSRTNSVMAGWDDDIFEGEEDGDSSDADEAAAARTKRNRAESGGSDAEGEGGGGGTSEKDIDAFLAKGRRAQPVVNTVLGQDVTKMGKGDGTTKGQKKEKGEGDTGPVIDTTLTASPKSTTTASVGLGKSVEEAMGLEKATGMGMGMGVPGPTPGKEVEGKEEEVKEEELNKVMVENGH